MIEYIFYALSYLLIGLILVGVEARWKAIDFLGKYLFPRGLFSNSTPTSDVVDKIFILFFWPLWPIAITIILAIIIWIVELIILVVRSFLKIIYFFFSGFVWPKSKGCSSIPF